MVRFLIEEIVVVVLVVLILCLPTQIESFIFNLSSGRTKCISEDLQIHAVTHAHYRITADPHLLHNHNISARVSDPKGETLHYSENVESGEFAFTANLDGAHTVCFWSPQFDPSSSSIPIEFEWKAGLATNHFTTASILKKDKIHFMELELKKLEESVHAIHDDVMHLKARGANAEAEPNDNLKNGHDEPVITIYLLGGCRFAVMAFEGLLRKEKDSLTALALLRDPDVALHLRSDKWMLQEKLKLH